MQSRVAGRLSAIAQRRRFRRTALAARAAALAAGFAGWPAAAQTVFQLDGAADLGTSATSGADRMFTELRPAVTIQGGSPRLAWRAGYLLAGSLTVGGTGTSSISNQLATALAAELTPRSTIAVGAGLIQGSREFHLVQQPADAGKPGFRTPGNPAIVTATLQESLVWEAAAAFRLRQGIDAALSAPQDDLGGYNASATGSLGLDRVFQKDAIGAEVRSTAAWLRPQPAEGRAFLSIANSLLGNWNHDFDSRWNGQLTGGVQQVVTYSGSYPLALVPSGTAIVRYAAGAAGGALTLSSGAAADVQTGLMSLTDSVVARGLVTVDPAVPRFLAVSAGFARTRPLGVAASRAAAGTGNAVQADVGMTWAMSEAVLITARYTLAYQFGQPAGLPPSLTQVVLLGVTARYSNARHVMPMPTLGQRVDGRDAVELPGQRERKP